MILKYISTFTVWFGLLLGIMDSDPKTTSTSETTAPEIQQVVNPIKENFLEDFELEAQRILRRVNQPGAAIAIVMDSSIVYTMNSALTISSLNIFLTLDYAMKSIQKKQK